MKKISPEKTFVFIIGILIIIFFIIRATYGFSIFGVNTECRSDVSYKSYEKFKTFPEDPRKIAFQNHPIQFLLFGLKCVYN